MQPYHHTIMGSPNNFNFWGERRHELLLRFSGVVSLSQSRCRTRGCMLLSLIKFFLMEKEFHSFGDDVWRKAFSNRCLRTIREANMSRVFATGAVWMRTSAIACITSSSRRSNPVSMCTPIRDLHWMMQRRKMRCSKPKRKRPRRRSRKI